MAGYRMVVNRTFAPLDLAVIVIAAIISTSDDLDGSHDIGADTVLCVLNLFVHDHFKLLCPVPHNDSVAGYLVKP